MDSFFIYRLPGQKRFIGGIGNFKRGIGTGFTIGSYSGDPESLITIEAINSLELEEINFIYKTLTDTENKEENINKALFPFPYNSTSEEIHINRVTKIIDNLCEGEKTVCSRIICGNGSINVRDTLLSLSEAFPNAMVFCFHSPLSGSWIGATPETLLRRKHNKLYSMALAGTRSADTKAPWNKKNIKEQQLVTDFISDTLNKHGLSFKYDTSPISLKAGPIEHLCTNFTVSLSPATTSEEIFNLLTDLSPTPAVCGYPKNKALSLIDETEDYPRGYYGGYLGPFEANGNFSLFVILRAVRFTSDCWCIFAGGGITPESNPMEELNETKKKAASIIDQLIFTSPHKS